ncbi:ribonuclease P protein component [Candidatus Fermentibacteria bacterium]|nr:ribonuclease P protein component [Candidatus Fermentibacteria bacterium]
MGLMESLKKPKDFRRTFRLGKWFHGEWLKAAFMPNGGKKGRLGFSVSTRYGNSVQRNRFKRRIRHLAAEALKELPVDVVVMPATSLSSVRKKDLGEEFKALAERIERDVE